MALTKIPGELFDADDLDLSDVGEIALDAIKGEADTDTSITFSGSNVITVKANNANQITFTDGAIVPSTDNDIDLGTSSVEFKDAFFDGTVTSDAFAGPLTGDVTGNVSGTAATVTGAAQSNITSLGTLTTLTVDNVIVNGTTIGHTSDTDLITLADGNVTIAGELDLTTLDVSGNADIDGTLEADAYTVDGTALNEYIADTIGAMVGSNTETGITVTYEDGDNTLDFVIGTLNQDTTGLAATATALATARTIGGTSFDGTANIVPATVTVADTTDTTSFVALFESATGDLGPKTDAAITYNAGTGALTATSFVGALTGNVTGNASGTAATVTGAAQTNITSLGTLTGLTVNGLTKFDQQSSTAGLGRIEFGNSGEPYIQGMDVGNGGSGAYLKLGINATDVIYINDDFTVGVGTTSPVTALTVATAANISQVALTSSSSAVAWDAKAAANAYHVTTENTTFSAPSNAVEGAIISVELAQGGTARTIAWNTVFEFAASTAPTVTATASKTDIYTFRYNGSVWQEIGRVQNMAQT